MIYLKSGRSITELVVLIILLLLFILTSCTSHSAPVSEDSISDINAEEKKEATIILSQWRGKNRDGIYDEPNLLRQWPKGGPNLIWQYDNLGEGYASAAVTDDKVYTVSTLNDTSYVIAFNHEGEVLWQSKMGAEFVKNYPGSRGTPIICSDFGYFLTGVGGLYCFDSENGNVIWQKDIMKAYNGRHHSSGFSENLLVVDDMVFVTPTGPDTCVVALNRKTGNEIWISRGEGEKNAYANPILIERGDKRIFVIQTLNEIIGIDIANGERLWKYPMESDVHSNTPVYKDGHILMIDNFRGRSMKLKLAEDGMSVSLVWKAEKLAAEQGDVVILGDRIYGADVADKSFNCVDWNTGQMLYKIVRVNKPNRVAVIAANGLLYCYASDGNFYLVNPLDTKFKTEGRMIIPGRPKYHYTHPVIHKGRLYVRHDNDLFVYDISS